MPLLVSMCVFFSPGATWVAGARLHSSSLCILLYFVSRSAFVLVSGSGVFDQIGGKSVDWAAAFVLRRPAVFVQGTKEASAEWRWHGIDIPRHAADQGLLLSGAYLPSFTVAVVGLFFILSPRLLFRSAPRGTGCFV
ncbi:hypothetical protein MRX96_015177 [Rhipicephalus microplus]